MTTHALWKNRGLSGTGSDELFGLGKYVDRPVHLSTGLGGECYSVDKPDMRLHSQFDTYFITHCGDWSVLNS